MLCCVVFQETLLHVACMLGHSKFIPVLMEPRCKQDVTVACSNKRTPLERVAENGDVESLRELLKFNVKLTACVLPYAATNGRLNFLK
jgi:ankyrin repeat protein